MHIIIVPHLNKVEEGGVLDYPLSVCPSVRTSLYDGYPWVARQAHPWPILAPYTICGSDRIFPNILPLFAIFVFLLAASDSLT